MTGPERYIVKSDGHCPDAVYAGMAWLAKRGGGAAVFPDAGALRAVFPAARTDAGRRRVESELARRGIRLDVTRGRIHVISERTLLVYPTEQMLEDYEGIAEWRHPESVLVISWNKGSCRKWYEERRPECLPGGRAADDEYKAMCDSMGVEYW